MKKFLMLCVCAVVAILATTLFINNSATAASRAEKSTNSVNGVLISNDDGDVVVECLKGGYTCMFWCDICYRIYMDGIAGDLTHVDMYCSNCGYHIEQDWEY